MSSMPTPYRCTGSATYCRAWAPRGSLENDDAAALLPRLLRTGLTQFAVDARWLLNPALSARYLGEFATELGAGRLSGATALSLVKCLLWHGRFDDATAAMEQVTDRHMAVTHPTWPTCGPHESCWQRHIRLWRGLPSQSARRNTITKARRPTWTSASRLRKRCRAL